MWPCLLITRRSQVQILPPLPTCRRITAGQRPASSACGPFACPGEVCTLTKPLTRIVSGVRRRLTWMRCIETIEGDQDWSGTGRQRSPGTIPRRSLVRHRTAGSRRAGSVHPSAQIDAADQRSSVSGQEVRAAFRRNISSRDMAQHVSDRPYVETGLIGDPSPAPPEVGEAVGSAAGALLVRGLLALWLVRVNGLMHSSQSAQEA
jgi:hypothetical protein